MTAARTTAAVAAITATVTSIAAAMATVPTVTRARAVIRRSPGERRRNLNVVCGKILDAADITIGPAGRDVVEARIHMTVNHRHPGVKGIARVAGITGAGIAIVSVVPHKAGDGLRYDAVVFYSVGRPAHRLNRDRPGTEDTDGASVVAGGGESRGSEESRHGKDELLLHGVEVGWVAAGNPLIADFCTRNKSRF